MTRIITALLIFLILITGGVSAEQILTVEKVRQLALDYNRQLLSAKKELDRARGEIISARSGALPVLSLDGRYTRNVKKREMFLPGEFFDKDGFIKVPAAQNNDYDLSLSLTQPLYVGGKVGTALQIARIYEKNTREILREIESDIVFNAESMFYAAILAESNLEVLKKSYDHLSYNLDVAEKNFSQGVISEYELLRARVEKLNIEPQLINAESDLSITRKQLKSFLGLELNEEIILVSDMSDTMSVDLPSLDSLITSAINTRPEIEQARLTKEGYNKAVRIAKGDWLYPNLYANAQYQLTGSSDDFKLSSNEISKSWAVSLIMNIPIFDGGRTIGEVRKAKVDYYQAMLREQQLQDDVRLEIEGAYDNLIKAKKALSVQAETIAQAEEGMKIADVRYESGIGTQLEVLSAQAALTQARTQLSQTVFQFRLAKAALKKAAGLNIL